MAESALIISTAALAISQAVAAFGTFLPKISDVRVITPESDAGGAADVRLGEVAAAAVTLSVGAIASSLTGSPVPFTVSLLVSLTLVAIYESTLRSVHPFEKVR